jgi:hypothetical protein
LREGNLKFDEIKPFLFKEDLKCLRAVYQKFKNEQLKQKLIKRAYQALENGDCDAVYIDILIQLDTKKSKGEIWKLRIKRGLKNIVRKLFKN